MSCNVCLGKFTKCFCISQRLLIAIMMMLATTTSYTTRSAISLAITEMVIKTNETLKNPDACPIKESKTYISVKNTDVLYKWNEVVQGLILSSYYWGYLISHVPGAYLAERFGGKHVLGVGMFVNSFLTLLSPPIIRWVKGDSVVIITTRVIMGVGQGVVYPVVTTLLGQWVPSHEKAYLASLAYSGTLLGSVIANAAGGYLIQIAKNWNIVFLLFGGLGLMWNVAWQLVCYSFPQTHPCIKDKEKEYLEEHLGVHVSKTRLKTPWKQILTSVPVWALVSAQFGHDWAWFVMATDLPKYMNAVLRFNVKENGFFSSLPYLLMFFVTLVGGRIADWLIQKDYLNILRTRQIFGTIGTFFPGAFMMGASYAGCDRTIAVVCFVLSMTCMGFYYPGVKVNALDLSPNFAGTIMAVINGIGVLSGIVIPPLIGLLTPNQTLFEWRLIFWITLGVCIVTNVIYVLFLSATTQVWNYHPQHISDENPIIPEEQNVNK